MTAHRDRPIHRGRALVVVALALGGFGCAERMPSGFVEHRRLALETGRAVVLEAVATARPGERQDRRKLGEGWGDGELDAARVERFAWAVGGVSTLRLEHSGQMPATVEVRGWPYHFEGAPGQRLTVAVNGVVAEPVELTPGGFDVRVPVPPGSLVAGENLVELRFDFAAAPADRDPSSKDLRPLAAAITEVVLSSADTGRGDEVGRAVAVDGQDLIVPPGAVAMFRLKAPERAWLVAERRPVDEQGPSPSGRVWVRDVAGRSSLELGSRRGRVAASLEDLAGSTLEVGFEGGAHGTLWRAPALWTPPGAQRPPNVLLIVVDTLRADFVGAYGGPVATPAMDGLAARGVRFERAFSHIPITGPSHSSLFTGRLPYQHGVHNNSQILPEEAFTLAESMRASGRATGAVLSLGVLRSPYGFAQGFDSYGDRFVRDWMKDAAEVTREAISWLEGVGDAPYFLFVHYSDPHEPYAPPTREYPRVLVEQRGRVVGELAADGRGHRVALELPPGASALRLELAGERPEYGFRFPSIRVLGGDVRVEPGQGWTEREKRFGPTVLDSLLPATLRLVNPTPDVLSVELDLSCKEKLGVATIRERYAEEVAFVDGRIGELLDVLEQRGDLARTLVVLTSDHGEGLGDHNHVGHISQLYDTLIHVPLVLSLPGVLPEGTRVSGPAALADLFPTLTDLLTIEPPHDPYGVSLLPAIGGASIERPIVAETYRPESASDKRALIEDGRKLISSRDDRRAWRELYDLDADPGELQDLARADAESLEAMTRRLAEVLAACGEGGPAVPEEATLSDEEKSQLRALGYLRD